MPVFLITGQQGAGKTLFTLQYVSELAEREGRSVYYSGIRDLRLPWTELDDAREWPSLPAGSIVVIDEAQRIYRPRASSSGVPRYVSELETHRHQGLDIFLITQHPRLLDANVRFLTGRHFHLVRKFGFEISSVHEFFEVRESPEKNRRDSLAREWKFPRESYGLYNSAESHTIKGKLPGRMKFALLSPLFLVACLFGLYYWWSNHYKVGSPAPEAKKSGSMVVDSLLGRPRAPASAPAAGVSKVSAYADAREAYLASFVPAVPGLAYTAPAYEKVTSPTSAPAPVACVASASRCACYTDQGTRLGDVSKEVCQQIVEGGFYVAWAEKKASMPASSQSPSSVSAPAVAPAAPAGPSVTVLDRPPANTVAPVVKSSAASLGSSEVPSRLGVQRAPVAPSKAK